MSRSIYFSAVNTPSYTHELIYRYDSPFSNCYSSKLEDKIKQQVNLLMIQQQRMVLMEPQKIG